ncbi:MAG: hypothetical protein IKE09_04885 [Clostridiales bacterium]|nr:hypothetical protein [Clostridiales bacterium]
MSRNKYGIKKDELYKITELVPIIKARLGKKCPYLEHGSLNEFTRSLGYTPSWNNGINGQGYREKYKGSDCIEIIDKMIETYKNDNKVKRPKRAQKYTITPKSSSLLPIVSSVDDFPQTIKQRPLLPLEQMAQDELIKKVKEQVIKDLIAALDSMLGGE